MLLDSNIQKMNEKKIWEIDSKAKTFKGWLLGRIKICINQGNYELEQMYRDCLKYYEKFNSKAVVKLEGWKGKSGIKIIERPNTFHIITYSKAHQDAEVKEITRIITKEEVNRVISSINILGEKTNTKKIAEMFCKISEIHINKKGNPLFYPNGEFEWQHFFSDRFLHTQLNLILRLLDYYGLIKYRAGRIKVIKKTATIQEVLR